MHVSAQTYFYYWDLSISIAVYLERNLNSELQNEITDKCIRLMNIRNRIWIHLELYIWNPFIFMKALMACRKFKYQREIFIYHIVLLYGILLIDSSKDISILWISWISIIDAWSIELPSFLYRCICLFKVVLSFFFFSFHLIYLSRDHRRCFFFFFFYLLRKNCFRWVDSIVDYLITITSSNVKLSSDRIFSGNPSDVPGAERYDVQLV